MNFKLVLKDGEIWGGVGTPKCKYMPFLDTSRRGFSLVEMLVVMAIGTAMMLFFMQSMVQINDAQVRMEHAANLSDLTNLIKDSIRTDGGCGNTFLGLTIPTVAPTSTSTPVPIPSIKDSSGNTVFNTSTSGGEYPPGRALSRLRGISFQLWSSTGNVTNTAKQAWLRINYSKAFLHGPISSGVRDLPITVVPDATGKVLRCYGAGVAELCSAVGGIYDAATGLCSQIDLNGQGGIRPGNQNNATLCDANHEGMIRYNRNNRVLEYCAGPSPFKWISPGGGSWCGFSWQDNCGGSGWTPGARHTTVSLCQGMNPRSGCPSGYSQSIIMDVQGSGRTNACYYTCVAN